GKNRGQTAHFARLFSDNQRLTLRNGCQTPVFPQPAIDPIGQNIDFRRFQNAKAAQLAVQFVELTSQASSAYPPPLMYVQLNARCARAPACHFKICRTIGSNCAGASCLLSAAVAPTISAAFSTAP